MYRVENRAVHTGCAVSVAAAATISIWKGFFGTGMCGWWSAADESEISRWRKFSACGGGGLLFRRKFGSHCGWRDVRRPDICIYICICISHSAVKIYNNNIYGRFSIAVPFGVKCERRARVAVVGAPDEWFMISSVVAPKPPPSSPPPYINATCRASAPVSGL